MKPLEFTQTMTAGILAWGAANFPALQIVTENQPLADEASMSPLWLDLEFRWYGATETSVGTRPGSRHSGAMACHIYSKEGEGTLAARTVIDSLNDTFRSKRFGGAILHVGQLYVPGTIDGWYKTGLFFPFILDEV